MSIAAIAERYSEMYDASSGDLAIFKIYEASLVDSENQEANVLIASCWRRHCLSYRGSQHFILHRSHHEKYGSETLYFESPGKEHLCRGEKQAGQKLAGSITDKVRNRKLSNEKL